MEKSFFVVEKAGAEVQEVNTIRIYITKSMLQTHLTKSGIASLPYGSCPGIGIPNMGPVSFQNGLLADIPNSFEVKFLPNLTGIEVYYPANLALSGDIGVRVTGMKFSLLTDGQEQFSVWLHRKFESKRSPTEDYYTMPDISTHHQYYGESRSTTGRLSSASWPDSANEIRIEINVSKLKIRGEIECTESKTVLPSSWPNPDAGFFATISKYFLSVDLSDVKIQCEEDTFPAHRFILCHSSEVFAAMLGTDMKESQENIIQIKDTESKVVREMLRFFYTGQVDMEILKEMNIKLYTLADLYMVENLKLLCVRSLVEHINRENSLEMYCFGKKNDISMLSQKAEGIIIANKKEFIKNIYDIQALMNALPAPMADELFKLLWNTA